MTSHRADHLVLGPPAFLCALVLGLGGGACDAALVEGGDTGSADGSTVDDTQRDADPDGADEGGGGGTGRRDAGTAPDGADAGPPSWCSPLTCEAANANCGPIGDGCGGIVQCGSCTEPEVCGGAGVPSQCGAPAQAPCEPRTCADVGATCGYVADGCGDVIQCGDCSALGLICGGDGVPNRCGGVVILDGECPALLTCEDVGASCGTIGDGCGGTLDCGACTGPDTCGGGGVANQCGQPVCTPRTCAEALALTPENCGVVSDGCGGVLDGCGVACELPETCGGGGEPDRCGSLDVACVPAPVDELCTTGSCGVRSDGCGGSVACGACEAPETCGGSGVPDTCGAPACVPVRCEDLGAECGLTHDGCGGLLDCGACPAGLCGGAGVPFQCAAPVCTQLTCDDVDATCGLAGDGCSGIIDCGACPEGTFCGAAGVPSQCGVPPCTPRTCADVGATCGSIGDGCGDIVECGTCALPETCGGGGQPSVCGRQDLVPSPTCGDGVLDALEVCDDGNTRAGDGCTETCRFVEPGFACETAGSACRSLTVCGDGLLSGAEQCDDRNRAAGDGCGFTCQLEQGWSCPVVGAACQAAQCGDGLVVGFEDCDDGNGVGGDGCSATCVLELGFRCDTQGQPCLPTVCGNGLREGSEACDDGNMDTGDGCSPICTFEPVCSGGNCTERCGDGLVLGAEACDDGNVRDGDGCSSLCQVERGFSCTLVAGEPVVPIVYRDFVGTNASNQNVARAGDYGPVHRDFEKYPGCRQDINTTVDAQGKPTLKTRNNCVEDATTFSQWYRSNDAINRTVVEILGLAPLTGQPNTYEYFDSTFYPLTGKGWTNPAVRCGNNQTCEQLRNNNFGQAQNFHFTSEVRYWFTFRGGEKLTFDGDDDVWVFIDRKLAVDIGGLHSAIQRWIQLPDPNNVDPAAPVDGQRGGDNAATYVTLPTSLGLVPGKNYEVAVFQAERHTTASQYRLTLQNFLSARSVCTWTCGDGITTRYEVCDDGAGNNTGAYGKCLPTCLGRGPRCGDAIVQSPQEVCDDGANVTVYSYGLDGGAACGPGCQPPVILSACTELTCTEVGAECGLAADGCGDVMDCGTCPEGERCVLNACAPTTCVPRTCASQGVECGPIADGCGGVLECGTCPAGEACGAGGVPNQCGIPACTPLTCADMGASCGVIGDGCVGVLECGACPEGQVCGGGGVPFQCGTGACTPRTCASTDATCGFIGDGCGGSLACGDCPFPLVCGLDGVPNQCGGACTPTTCAAQGAECGALGDGCGGRLDCGTCPPGETCGVGGNNQCGSGCVPTTCAAFGAECGVVGNGCGGTVDCGSCPAGSGCGIGGEPNKCAPLPSCTAQTCAQAQAACGLIGDGCGDVVDCGACGPGQACGAGGVPNQCAQVCAPRTCEDINAECGYIADGCGGVVNCGACPGVELCGYDGRANKCGFPQAG